ncbi:MAG: hypothetical protein GY943_34490 [Chloroflexi bacterium]|nr:hypothetical protein [Chloroflexota bacterium]
MTRTSGFSQGIGQWLGTAEVYDGNGRFLGNATDRRHVQRQAGENRIRIDLSFVGPFKFAGHYYIEDHTDYRLYQGPANTGFAETLADNLIDANAYWPVTGLTQRFFLMVLPGGNKQMSLALMSRGEKLIYVVVGEYNRVDEQNSGIPALVNGTSYDLINDPAAGRGNVLLHQSGTWHGQLATLDGDLNAKKATDYTETVHLRDQSTASNLIDVEIRGAAFAPDAQHMTLKTNGWEAWSEAGSLVGSYSLSGGRALSGQFHYLDQQLRVWRREVVSHDGRIKTVVHTWYRGGQRVGVQFGVLNFK